MREKYRVKILASRTSYPTTIRISFSRTRKAQALIVS
jgi:hypothetical protein